MDPDASHRQITEYIRANRDRYAREAIREQLISAGHDPARVDAAWELEVGAAQGGPPGKGIGAFAWALFVLAALIGAFSALALSTLAYVEGSGSVPILWAIFAISYLAVGYGNIRLLRWAVPRFSISGLWAGLLGLVLIPICGILMFGTRAGAYSLTRGG